MILDGCHFQYGGFNSRSYGIIFAHCNTNVHTDMIGEISSSTFFNRKQKTAHLLHDNYDNSPIRFEAEILSDNAKAFTQQERREIEKALFQKTDYRRLYIDLDDDFMGDSYEYVDGVLKRLYFNCRFMNPSKIEDGNGLVVGYQFTIECDSCLAWQDAIEQEFVFHDTNTDATHTINIDVDTNIGGYTYPDIEINIGVSGGDISIVNVTDEATRITGFVGTTTGSSIKLNGNINYISGNYYDVFSHQNFPRLLDGTNTFIISGDVNSVKFKWNNRRFL